MRDNHLYRRILGIRFFAGSAEQAVERGLDGGLVVAPAAPLLVLLRTDPATRDALLASDLAIIDSGLMVLLWALRTGEKLTRVSGLRYLLHFLHQPIFREPGKIFWIVPNAGALARNLAWLRSAGFPANEDDHYVAPMYGPEIDDHALIEKINARQPAHIFVGLGGGTQERLGFYLRDNLEPRRAGIHCIGAAIGFLNGDQGPIPNWADKFFLGWLIRCLQRPRMFIPRYWNALRVIPMVLRYGSRLPPPLKAI